MSGEDLRTRILKRKEDTQLPTLKGPGSRKYLRYFRPDVALGLSAGSDIEDVQFRIGMIIVASLIVAILSTVAYTQLKDETKLSHYLVAAFSISWFLFASFIFLLFNQTRLLHIIFFGIVIALCSVVYTNIDREEPIVNKTSYNLALATMVFGAVCFVVLLYYWLTSRKEEEIIELKTTEKLKKREEEVNKRIREEVKNKLSEIEADFKKKYETQTDISKAYQNAFNEIVSGRTEKKKNVRNSPKRSPRKSTK